MGSVTLKWICGECGIECRQIISVDTEFDGLPVECHRCGDGTTMVTCDDLGDFLLQHNGAIEFMTT